MSEISKWVFIEDIPLLFEVRRVSRQFQVELWLDSSMLLQTFDFKPVKSESPGKMRYIA